MLYEDVRSSTKGKDNYIYDNPEWKDISPHKNKNLANE